MSSGTRLDWMHRVYSVIRKTMLSIASMLS